MTQHDIAASAHRWATGAIAAVALVAVIAHAQRQDAADNKAARAQVQKQIRGEVRK